MAEAVLYRDHMLAQEVKAIETRALAGLAVIVAAIQAHPGGQDKNGESEARLRLARNQRRAEVVPYGVRLQ
jgi:hypothetical protein